MLASTVQFSNNDQPPITPNPSRVRVHWGRRLRRRSDHSLRHPTACPTPLADKIRVPRRSSTGVLIIRSVPSSQRSTHEQPASDIR
jgi:hypothetical protein